jgi:hypothetical protein
MMMLAMAAASRTQGDDITRSAEIAVPVQGPSIASLSLAPGDLYQLWNEYLHGILAGGRKPAKHFVSQCN